jgi:hypothetical protein
MLLQHRRNETVRKLINYGNIKVAQGRVFVFNFARFDDKVKIALFQPYDIISLLIIKISLEQ